LNLLASTIAERSRGHKFFRRSLARFGPKSCFLGSYSPSPSCIPNLKLLASTVAEINRGSQIILDTPLAQTPANFGPKSCFLVSYSPGPSCIRNLKLLASTVAEINKGSQIFTCSPSPDPINFGPESCFGKLLPVPKLCKNFLAQCASMMTGTVCFEEKKLFVMQNLGIWR